MMSSTVLVRPSGDDASFSRYSLASVEALTLPEKTPSINSFRIARSNWVSIAWVGVKHMVGEVVPGNTCVGYSMVWVSWRTEGSKGADGEKSTVPKGLACNQSLFNDVKSGEGLVMQ